jgi:hypothetical protein
MSDPSQAFDLGFRKFAKIFAEGVATNAAIANIVDIDTHSQVQN